MSIVDRIGKSMDDRYAQWQLAALADLVDATGRKVKVRASSCRKRLMIQFRPNKCARCSNIARKIATDSNADVSDRLTAIRLLGADRTMRESGIERLMGLLARA